MQVARGRQSNIIEHILQSNLIERNQMKSNNYVRLCSAIKQNCTHWKFFESSITQLIITKASSVSLHPRRFLPRLSGEYMVFTEIYESRDATGIISLFWVVIKNKQMDYIEQIEQNRTKSKD